MLRIRNGRDAYNNGISARLITYLSKHSDVLQQYLNPTSALKASVNRKRCPGGGVVSISPLIRFVLMVSSFFNHDQSLHW